MNDIQIDSHIKMPKDKEPLYMKTARRIFKAYASAYEIAYIRRPTEWSYDNKTGFIRVLDAGHTGVGWTLKRMKELTRSLRERMKQ